jgi:SAM-dependent methyltransferase
MKFIHKLPRPKVARSRDEAILELCRGKTVLHLGFVDEGLLEKRVKCGEWLHEKVVHSAKRAVGFDISEYGVARSRQMGFKDCYVVDVEKLDATPNVPRLEYDVVLATDIIEHLDNPGNFLKALHSIMGPSTILVITTPNALSLRTIWYPFARLEVVHPDHNSYFSPSTLAHLLVKFGFKMKATILYSPKFIPSKDNITGVWDLTRKWLFVTVDWALGCTLVRMFPYFNDGMLLIARTVWRDTTYNGVGEHDRNLSISPSEVLVSQECSHNGD